MYFSESQAEKTLQFASSLYAKTWATSFSLLSFFTTLPKCSSSIFPCSFSVWDQTWAKQELIFFFFQSATWSYLCKGAVCKVSGELSLHHQSQSGPFISIALHVCISDSDPACVSLGPRACFTASVCILLRETQRRERGSAPYVWRRAWCCFLKVE